MTKWRPIELDTTEDAQRIIKFCDMAAWTNRVLSRLVSGRLYKVKHNPTGIERTERSLIAALDEVIFACSWEKLKHQQKCLNDRIKEEG